jgi:hypothetical protein
MKTLRIICTVATAKQNLSSRTVTSRNLNTFLLNVCSLSESRKNFVDFGLNETFFRDELHILNVPEIKEIVLNVCAESIPQDYRFAGTLNY